jgi:predicted nucleic acid-binding protein
MITAVDTNILLDVFLPDPKFSKTSSELLRNAYDDGGLIICEIVYAELVPQFRDRNTLDRTLKQINVTLSPFGAETAFVAGEKLMQYRKSGGRRDRIITDFLIGAHAISKAERFLTRDRGFYSTYFKALQLLA